MVLLMKTLIQIQVTILVSWKGEEAVSGFVNLNPSKTLAILITKPSGWCYYLRCIQVHDQRYKQLTNLIMYTVIGLVLPILHGYV